MEIKHKKKEKEGGKQNRMGQCEKAEKGWWILVTTVIQFKAKNKYNIYFQLAGYTVSFSEHLLGEHVTQVYYCCTDRIVPSTTVKGWLKTLSTPNPVSKYDWYKVISVFLMFKYHSFYILQIVFI